MHTGSPAHTPRSPFHTGWQVRIAETGWGMIGARAGLQIWGCPHALPASPREPATHSTPRFAPRARRPDLASGPEALARTCWRGLQGRPGRAQPLQSWCPSSSDAESTRRRLPTRFYYFDLLVLSGACRVVGSRAGWSAARAGMVGQGCSSVRAVWEGQEPAGRSRRAPKWPRAACHPRPFVRRRLACYPGSVWPSRACRRPKSC